MLPNSRLATHHNTPRTEMSAGDVRTLSGTWLDVVHDLKLALHRSTAGKWSTLWSGVGRRVAPNCAQSSMPSGTGEFGTSCILIGQWTGTRATTPDNEQSPADGNNNLLAYVLRWESAPAARCYASKTGNPGQLLGFEHYLNCLHPGDLDVELNGIKTQLLNRQPLALSALRMRIDNSGWTHVQVRRLFEYSDANGELTRLTLQLAVDTSRAVVTD